MTVSNESFDTIETGARVSRRYTISPAVYSLFLEAFEDVNPVHVDEGYARARGFDGKVMHGAILNGFLSHFIGVHFPGRRALLLSADLRYASPSYLGDMLEIQATVAQKAEAHCVLVLHLKITNLTRNTVAARGRVQVAMAVE
jgi:acyl dehydratase